MIGVGVAGLYQLYRLRELGLSVRCYEDGGGVGGAWYWNRYPGCRFDSESETYGYSWSKELLQEWDWKEHYSGQPENEKYLNYVADKFDLRKDIQFNSRVTSAVYDEKTNRWDIQLESGQRARAQFLIAAVGLLSSYEGEPATSPLHAIHSLLTCMPMPEEGPCALLSEEAIAEGMIATAPPHVTAMNDQPLQLPHSFSHYLREPLQQRPAGSMGKRGVCELSFAPRWGKTRLQSSFVTHPFHLTTPWYLDATLPGMAVVYLQTPAGGLIQGDRARMRFTLAPLSQAHLTTQAAEKIHSMTANCAVQQLSFSLGAGASGEYCPEPVILFPGARFAQSLEVTLEPGASFFLSELFLSRRAVDGLSFEAFATTFQVRDTQEGLLVHDRSLVQAREGYRLTGPGVLGEHHAWGQAFLVGPTIPSDWSQQLQQLLCAEPRVICGATLLPKARGMCIKVVGSHAPAIRRALHITWDYLRARLFGVPAPSFPK